MASTVPYVKNTAWADGSGGGTPVTAAKLNTLEQGVADAHLMPTVRVYHNVAQSIANVTFTALAFNTERFDTAGGATAAQHDTATNNSRLTCLYAGKYMICGCIEFAASATGSIRYADIYLNNTTIVVADARAPLAGGNLTKISIATIYDLAVNDYVQLRVYQDSAGALNVNSSGNLSPEFMMTRIA